ncbi:MAG: peptide chain release factor N(5)-glutamine methyltransferase [Methylovulum miyakonense]|uniref:peptide chain release factor N(5)-glutamine methyltransferase n=1 Tax=Methylovulum miyakonense TaxID=645578 RepID=UPI003BB6FCA5
MPTIKTLLAQAADSLAAISGSPALDAEVLLCQVLGKPRPYLRAWCDQAVSEAQFQEFQRLWRQRLQGQPIAYLTGQREFWSRDFLVTPAVLIPRPDTELLIDLGLKLIPAEADWNIIDLGTGSGIIAITIAAERPNTRLTAVDRSLEALQVAQQNAGRHHIQNIHFHQSDWFKQVPAQRFQLVISNPPYIAEHDWHLQHGDVRFEPQSALIAGDQGLSDIKAIAETAKNWLVADGWLLIEHGYDQETAVQAIFKSLGYQQVQTERDLSGQPRVTYGQLQTL